MTNAGRARSMAVMLIAAAVGCGQPAPSARATSSLSPTRSVAPTPTPTPTPMAPSSVGLNIVSVDGPTGGPPGGIRCPLWSDRTDQIVLSRELVGSDTVPAGTLRQQGEAYWKPTTTGARNTSTPLPAGLRRVPGVLTSGPSGRPPTGSDLAGTNFFWGSGCSIDLQITNVGSAAVQIPVVGLRLTRRPEVNTQHYDLVDRCSVALTRPVPCFPQLGGGAAPCQLYTVQVQLSMGDAGAVFVDTPASAGVSGLCPLPTISPGATVELWIMAVSAQNYVYPVTPELTVQTKNGERRISLVDFSGSMAFASPEQFSCWKLQASAFIKALDGAAVLPPVDPKQGRFSNFNSWQTAGVWCI